VPIRSLGTEYFDYDETRHALVGSRSGAMHRLGDVVDVRLVEAQPVAGALRFELLSDGQVPRGRERDGFERSERRAKDYTKDYAKDRPARAKRKKREKRAKNKKPDKTRKPEPKRSDKPKRGKSWKP